MDQDLIEAIGTFDGGYGRGGVIEFRRLRECDLCKKAPINGLYSDGSEGEYAGASICVTCLESLVMRLRKHESDKR